jgi:hypothetical protein
MMTENERLSDDHDNFKQLAAWAASGLLTAGEWAEFTDHSQSCQECTEVYRQFLVLAHDGMSLLVAHYDNQEERGDWNDALVRGKLFDRIRSAGQQLPSGRAEQLQFALPASLVRRLSSRMFPLVPAAALAVCLIAAVGFVGYGFGSRMKHDQTSTEDRLEALVAEKQQTVDTLKELLNAQKQDVLRLEQERSLKALELTKLRARLRRVEELVNQAPAAGGASDEELKSAKERDALNIQLRDAEQSYADIQTEVASLRSERDEALIKSASLESEIKEISAASRNQEQRLADDKQYLASDRDIRELMGARKLYIADVFDVDSRSRTRKPFGRVFYTQGKSLIFYAFDLDGQADVTNANAFQVWGRNVTDLAKPLNLGILYLDSEANRRWVLRFDDPKQLEEIDAVFVTVEPRGGSRKPTAKPFLYALLRKEANHP